MRSSLELLKEKYPGRAALTAAEVASVLSEKSTRGAAQYIREQMKSGRLPGAVRVGQRLRMPITVLAAVLDGEPTSTRPMPVIPLGGVATATQGRRRSAIGPRAMGFVHVLRFWEELFGSFAESELAEDLVRTRAALEFAIGLADAQAQAPGLDAAMGAPRLITCPACQQVVEGRHKCEWL